MRSLGHVGASCSAYPIIYSVGLHDDPIIIGLANSLVESSTRALKFQLDSSATRITLVLIEHPVAILNFPSQKERRESSFETIEGQSVRVSAAISLPLCRER